MPLLSSKEVLKLKLSCIPLKSLKQLSLNLGIKNINKGSSIIKEIIAREIDEDIINEFTFPGV